jgi:hypothetical protein
MLEQRLLRDVPPQVAFIASKRASFIIKDPLFRSAQTALIHLGRTDQFIFPYKSVDYEFFHH